jgi:hypothetical protein
MRHHTRLVCRATTLALAATGSVLAQDVPDPYFVDSNGDGIDGELNQAIFVAPPPLGNNLNSGLTPELPVATISQGITLAQTHMVPQVLIQTGTYNESVTLASGISLFGGYDATWTRVPSTAVTATIVQANGTAVLAQNINTPTQVSFLTLRPANATTPGSSSYGARVINSSGLRFWFNRVEPGNGASGLNGNIGTPALGILTMPDVGQPAIESENTTAQQGGNGGTSGCGMTGGKGGNGGVGSGAAQVGAQGAGSTQGGPAGASSSTSFVGGNGGRGSDGSHGAHGADGFAAAATVGMIGSMLYVPPVSGNGAVGAHGNGGGGGGAGGCRGGLGTGGQAGGGSFGLLIAPGSTPDVRDSVFVMRNGGMGGSGGSGAPGSTGAPGVSGGPKQGSTEGGSGGSGGDGGDGGDGGSGAGGHGGPSIGIFDPGNGAVVNRLRYQQAPSAGIPGAHGANNGNPAPVPGIRALRHPVGASAQGEPTPSITSITIVEPLSGTTTAYIPITLSGTTENITDIGYAATNGTAIGTGTDFTLPNGSVAFNPWTNEASIAVTIHADAVSDSGETFTISPTGPFDGSPATITIVEDALFSDGFD